MMLEILGLVARVAFEVLLEVIWFWWPADRHEYNAYVDAVPPGEKPLSRRKWKAAGEPSHPEMTTHPETTTKTAGE
ncbi:hypothetical protein [Arthrobacter sp. N1]|uniref:hypothetical protein n=1 Tax=Arthrobacter sp. N1 TaxID=619291 RepID=UPI003BB1B40B